MMANRVHSQEARESLRKQIAAAVRSIQWTYAVYWSPSTTEPGVLTWGEGFYNGDIKTRRTVQTTDREDDQGGFERSDQLRELYESLLSGNSNPQARRPLAALSPEDLTNVEWYYVVCMSFVFNTGQGLPGMSLANGRPIWLSNAHFAYIRVFCRSLLAKSAGIETIVCFPFMSGVIELGVTDMVQEDLDLIQHIKTEFLENSTPFLSWKTNSLTQFSDNTLHTTESLVVQGEDMEISYPNGSLNGEGPVQPPIDEFLFEDHYGEATQAQSWHLVDDELSNCVHTYTTSSDDTSHTNVNPVLVFPTPKPEVTNKPTFQLQENVLEDWDQGKTRVLDHTTTSEDLHYQNVLSLLLKSDQLQLGQSFRKLDEDSNFITWRKGGKKVAQISEGTPQNMLKKILFEVPQMQIAHSQEPKEHGVIKDEIWQQLDIHKTNHVIAERRRREKVNERISTLKSLIPSITKVDKISILDDTISYIKKLERRVGELKSCHEVAGHELKNKRTQDMEERTSDNYRNEVVNNKRKAREVKEGIEECCQLSTIEDSLIDTNTITVRMVEKDILISIRCPWKESLLLEIIDTARNLHLDSQSVQSSTVDGILSLTMKSKLKESCSSSAGMIMETLQRVITKR